jgi:LPXTG-motif cell wall-anchored protein
VTCTATYQISQVDLDRGELRNRASVVASEASTGTEVNDFGSLSLGVPGQPSLGVTKTVSAATAPSGSTVTFTIVATNTGNVPLSNVVVSDPMVGLSPLVCPGFNGTLVPGQSVTCTATYRAASSDAVNGKVTNTATATGVSPAGATVTRSGTAVLDVSGRLPRTGSEIGMALTLAILLTLVGSGLLLARRRRVA